MRNPNRIETTLKEIERIWKNNPDLRLCQLLLNIVTDANVLYYVEDADLIKALQEVYDN